MPSQTMMVRALALLVAHRLQLDHAKGKELLKAMLKERLITRDFSESGSARQFHEHNSCQQNWGTGATG